MPIRVDRRAFLRTASAASGAIAVTGVPAILAADKNPGCDLASERLGWRLGITHYTLSHEGLTLYEAIDRVASLGLKVIVGMVGGKLDQKRPEAVLSPEMSAADRRELKARLDNAGVQMAGCWVGNPEQADASRRLFELAKDLDIKVLDGEPPVQSFDMLEKLCDEYHVSLGVHNHPKPTPYWNPETLLKAIRGRGKWIGACCDTGHWVRSGLDPVAMLQRLEGHIITFDLKDVSEVGTWGRCVALGTGKGNVRGMFQELKRQRFRGFFGLEFDQRPSGTELTESIAFFNKMADDLA